MGVVTPGRAVPGGVQLSLPLEPPEAPALRELTRWERLVADYGSFKISIAEHPMALLRPDLPQARDVEPRARAHCPTAAAVTVAGLVVARQRPATAKGVTFMLLEDEWGTINLIVPPPVYQRHRLVVRAEPFVLASGRLERRHGMTNVVVDEIAAHRAARPAARRREAHRAAGRPRDRPRRPSAHGIAGRGRRRPARGAARPAQLRRRGR